MKKIILQGIAYDAKSSFMRGPALAPAAIREQYGSEASNFYAENGTEIIPDLFDDRGDFSPSEYFDIEEFTYNNLNVNLPLITLGGDHSISFPLVKAINRKFGDFDILHFDAHSDLYDEFEGDKYSHACPFARIMEEGLTDKLIQLGIRTMTKHQKEQAEKYKVEVIPAASVDPTALKKLNRPVYISFDLDVLDPAYAPGVSHHEPGGLSSRQVLNIIQSIEVPVLGADIVEYNPLRDLNNCTGVLCAKLLKEISAIILANQKQ